MVWIIKNVYTGETHQITCEGLTVGRQRKMNLVCMNIIVSKTQAKLFLLNNVPYVVDGESSNGTYVNGRNIKSKGQIKLEEDVELGFGMYRTKGSDHPNCPCDDIKKPYYIYKVINLPELIDICDSDNDDVYENDNNELVPVNKETVAEIDNDIVLIDTLTPKENGESSKDSRASPINLIHNDICNLNSESVEPEPKNYSHVTAGKDKIEQDNAAANLKLSTRCDNNSLSKNCDTKVKTCGNEEQTISREEMELRELLVGLEEEIVQNEDEKAKTYKKETRAKERDKEQNVERKAKRDSRSTSTSSSNYSAHTSHKSGSRKGDTHKSSRSSHGSSSRSKDRRSDSKKEHHGSTRSNSHSEIKKNEATKENKKRKNGEHTLEKQAVVILEKCDAPKGKNTTEIVKNGNRSDDKTQDKYHRTNGRINIGETSKAAEQTRTSTSTVSSAKVIQKNKEEITFSGHNMLNLETAPKKVTTLIGSWLIKKPDGRLKASKNKLATHKDTNFLIEVPLASSSLTFGDDKYKNLNGKCDEKAKAQQPEKLGNKEDALLEGITNGLENHKKVDALVEGVTKNTAPKRKLTVRNFSLKNSEKPESSIDVSQDSDKRRNSDEVTTENINEVPPPEEIIELSDGEEVEFMRSQLYIKEEPTNSDECQDNPERLESTDATLNEEPSTSGASNGVTSQLFLKIKREVEACDAFSETFVRPPVNLDYSEDYDYDDEFIRILYQEDNEGSKTTPTPSDFTSVENDNIAIDYTVENNQVEEEDSRQSDNSLVIDEIHEEPAVIEPPIVEVAKRKRGRPRKSSLPEPSSEMAAIAVKKFYTAPPIIEPHTQDVLRKKRGRPFGNQSNEERTTITVKKRRVSTAAKTTDDPGKTSKDQLVTERKQKLKELALKAAGDKERNENQYKPKNPVHVKVSSGRGNFLLPPSAQRDPRLNSGNRVQNYGSDGSKYESQHRFLQEFSEMIYDIIKWKVEWFQDADSMKPPQLTTRNLIGMCMSFACYNDYFDVLYPLLMFDCWNCACSDYRETKKSSNTDIMAAIMNIFIKPTHTEILCTAWLESKVNLSNNHLKDRNLVSLTGKVKQEMRMMFGVVGWAHKEPIKKSDTVDSGVLRLCKTCPTTKLTFSLIIENNKEQFEVGSRIYLRYFPNLPQYFKNYSMLKRLQYSSLIEYLLDPQPQDDRTPQCNRQVFSLQQRLNPSQVQAISESVSLCVNDSPGIYLIEGPPGTGKSTVITSIIMEIVLKCNAQKNHCILLLAPSNAAIDSLITKLSYEIRPTLDSKQRGSLKLVRVGHPDSVSQNILPLTLEKLAEKNAVNVLLTQNPPVRKDYEALVSHVKQLTAMCQNSNDEALFKKCLAKQEELSKFFKTRFCVKYNDIVRDQQRKVLASANIICSTIGSCQKAFAGEMRDNIKFCIIDEASQASEIDTLIPIGLGVTKLVLVGDPKQLPAVTTNKLSKTLLYGQSLFARIKNKLESTNFDPKLLNVQYRMNPEIAKYPNKAFYEGRIINSHKYKVKPGLEKLTPYMVFSYDWSIDRPNNQYYNRTEVQCIVELLQVITRTVSKGTKLSIGIITPYGEQRHVINQELSALKYHSTVSITCNTVDSFQGQEKDVILLSCVRLHSNSFLADENRLCVALTRAKHALYIVGNLSLLSNCDTFSKLLYDAKDRNLYFNISCAPKAVPWERLIKKSSR